MADDMMVSPRKKMAMTGGGDYGCDPIPAARAEEKPHGKMVKDGDRASPPPVKHTKGKMPSQAEADHGPHGMMAGMGGGSITRPA